MEAIAVDMNPAGNTATSLGNRQECLNALPGETIMIDVTANGVPSSTAMIAYAYTLIYDGPTITISNQEPLLIVASPGSSLLNASDTRPDFDGMFTASVVDLGDTPGSSESGSGVLDRLTIEVSADAAPALYNLKLEAAGHIDSSGDVFGAQSILDGRLAIGVSCSASTPIPPKTLPPQVTQEPGVTDPPGSTTLPPVTGTPGDSPTPGNGTPDPNSDPDGSTTATPLASRTLTPTASAANGDIDNDGGGGSDTAIFVALVVVAAAVIGLIGWFIYRRTSSGQT